MIGEDNFLVNIAGARSEHLLQDDGGIIRKPEQGRTVDEVLASFELDSLEDQYKKQLAVKQAIKDCVKVICDNCPTSKELEQTLQYLHDALQRANVAITMGPNPFYKNNMTDRAKFIAANPDRWRNSMRDAGLSSPTETYK